jgi:hypothetical protein
LYDGEKADTVDEEAQEVERGSPTLFITAGVASLAFIGFVALQLRRQRTRTPMYNEASTREPDLTEGSAPADGLLVE